MRNGCHDFLTKDTMTAEHLQLAILGALRSAAQHRDLVAQNMRRHEMIRRALMEALMNRDVKGTVVSLFRDEMRRTIGSLMHRW